MKERRTKANELDNLTSSSLLQ